ncbi:MAG: hypothetical protein AVDCRST_MAG47-2379, partial [uncultured Nocardioidaceae bacterium]
DDRRPAGQSSGVHRAGRGQVTAHQVAARPRRVPRRGRSGRRASSDMATGLAHRQGSGPSRQRRRSHAARV